MFAEDLSAFFTDFAQAVLVGAIGQETTILGIFDNGFQALVDGGSVTVASSQPNLTVKSADVETLGVGKNTRIVVDGQDWLVREVQADGTGITRLMLHLKTRG